MKKFVSVALVGAMALSMLVGCGAKEEAPAAEAPQATEEIKEEAPAAEATEEAAPSAGKKYVIATDTVFKPFEYTDESGAFV